MSRMLNDKTIDNATLREATTQLSRLVDLHNSIRTFVDNFKEDEITSVFYNEAKDELVGSSRDMDYEPEVYILKESINKMAKYIEKIKPYNKTTTIDMVDINTIKEITSENRFKYLDERCKSVYEGIRESALSGRNVYFHAEPIPNTTIIMLSSKGYAIRGETCGEFNDETKNCIIYW